MKIGVSYNLFDGEELLEGSIKSIREEVDYISVVYQVESNFGNKCDSGLVPLLEKLLKDGLVDELFEYRPKVNKGGHHNEITKRNIGVSLSLGVGCTHHMSMDSDEYYLLDEFKYMKGVMEDGGYDSSACQLLTYYKEPIYRLDPPEDYYVSLLYKISESSEYSMGSRLPVLVDPTRCMKPGKCKIFTRDEIEMHHMSYIRKNIRRKLQNSSAVVNFKDRVNKLVDYHEKWEFPKQVLMAGAPDKFYNIVEVDKQFDTWK
jgi:hypothetical protein